MTHLLFGLVVPTLNNSCFEKINELQLVSGLMSIVCMLVQSTPSMYQMRRRDPFQIISVL